MRRGLGLLLLVGSWAAACGDGSGQTGSALCASPTSCACVLLDGRMLFRATTVAFAGDMPVFEVEEILTPTPGFELVAPGFRIQGAYVTRFLPERAHEHYCPGLSEEPPVLGEPVLLSATIHLPDSCGDCVPCARTCPTAVFTAQGAVYLPWQDSYDFDGEPLAPLDLVPLTERGACRELFPYPPETECNDVVGRANSKGCGQ